MKCRECDGSGVAETVVVHGAPCKRPCDACHGTGKCPYVKRMIRKLRENEARYHRERVHGC
jgi:DnaJ-class molecular chaperone